MELELQPLDSDLARGLLAGLPPSAMQKSVPLSSGISVLNPSLLDSNASGVSAGAERLGRSSRVRSESLGNGIGFGTSIDLGINMDIGLAVRTGSPGLFGAGGSFSAGGGGGGGRTRSDSLFGGVGAPPLMGTQWTTSTTVQNSISMFAPMFGTSSTAAASSGIALPIASSVLAQSASSSSKPRPHGEKRPRGISAQFAIDAGSFDAGPMFSGAVYGSDHPVMPRRARASSDMDNSNNFGGVGVGGGGGGGALLGRNLQARRDTLGGLTEGILSQSQAFASADIWAHNDSDNEESGGLTSAGRGGPSMMAGFQSNGVYTADDAVSSSSSSSATFLRSEPGILSQPANYQLQQQQQPQQQKQQKGRSKLGGGASATNAAASTNAPANPKNSTASDISVNAISQPQHTNGGASTSLNARGEVIRTATSRDVHTPTLSFTSSVPAFSSGGVFGAPPKMQGSMPAASPAPQFTVPKQQVVMPYLPLPSSNPTTVANLKGKAVGSTGTGVSAASRAAQAAAVDDDLEIRLRGGGEKEVGPVMQWLLRSAPRLIEGSLVPQVRETVLTDGISMPLVPAIPGWVGAYPHEARIRRVAQFLEKRSRRVWEKTVKYDVRKSFADSRLRVKGRFVKKEDEALLRDFCQLL